MVGTVNQFDRHFQTWEEYCEILHFLSTANDDEYVENLTAII